MKTEQLLIGLAVFAFMIPSSLAVVGGPEPGEGEMGITSTGSSAGAPQAVGPNGTQWKAEVAMVNMTQNVTDDRLENVRYGDQNYTAEFTGYITAPTPCHTITHDVNERNGTYVMQIDTQRDQLDNGTGCIQVLTMIEYDAEFSTDETFTLKVKHGNRTVETLYHPGLEKEGPEVDRGPVGSLINWVKGLLGMQKTMTAEQSTTVQLEGSEGDIVVKD